MSCSGASAAGELLRKCPPRPPNTVPPAPRPVTLPPHPAPPHPAPSPPSPTPSPPLPRTVTPDPRTVTPDPRTVRPAPPRHPRFPALSGSSLHRDRSGNSPCPLHPPPGMFAMRL